MSVGTISQSSLESNYQNPGDIYLDTKTEGALQVIVDQVNANAGIFTNGGSALIVSDPIAGVTGATVYDQLVSIEGQIQSAVGGIVPPSTITTAMIQDEAVTFAKLEKMLKTASVGGTLFSYQNLGGL